MYRFWPFLTSLGLLCSSCTKKPSQADSQPLEAAVAMPQDDIHAPLNQLPAVAQEFGPNWQPNAQEKAELARLEREAPRFAESKGRQNRAVAVFTTHCQSCHGKEGRSGGPLADSLPVAPTNFHEWPIKYGSSLAELALSVSHGRNEGVMPAFAQSLSQEDLWSVVYLLHDWIHAKPKK